MPTALEGTNAAGGGGDDDEAAKPPAASPPEEEEAKNESEAVDKGEGEHNINFLMSHVMWERQNII